MADKDEKVYKAFTELLQTKTFHTVANSLRTKTGFVEANRASIGACATKNPQN